MATDRAAVAAADQRWPPGESTPRREIVNVILCCRRLDHAYERLPEHSAAMVKWAMIGLMTRLLATTRS